MPTDLEERQRISYEKTLSALNDLTTSVRNLYASRPTSPEASEKIRETVGTFLMDVAAETEGFVAVMEESEPKVATG